MRKFILKYHRGSDNKEERERERVIVPLDVLVEVDKVTFIVEDDWFEVKMRANYVVRERDGESLLFLSLLFYLSLFFFLSLSLPVDA